MAKKKKKGPAPRKKSTGKKKMSGQQIAFSIVAVLMVILMIGPLLIQILAG
ncbi:MAG TPA: hypothetical protein VJ965_04300 [Anaerolineales bacterium]|nr:hypothetical protein [Anaerolineales bacterium]